MSTLQQSLALRARILLLLATPGATHWSVRLMAKYARVTTWQVRQVWAASDLKPHRLKTLKISYDPHFADKVVDVVGLYLDPPDNVLVLSVGKRPPITHCAAWLASPCMAAAPDFKRSPE